MYKSLTPRPWKKENKANEYGYEPGQNVRERLVFYLDIMSTMWKSPNQTQNLLRELCASSHSCRKGREQSVALVTGSGGFRGCKVSFGKGEPGGIVQVASISYWKIWSADTLGQQENGRLPV